MTTDTETATRPHRSPAGFVALLVIGALLTLAGFVTAAGGIVAAGLAAVQGNHGFLTSPRTPLATAGYAVTSPRTTEFGVPQPPGPPFGIGQVQVSVQGSRPLFVGIAPQADVQRYLQGVPHAEVTEVRYRPFQATYRVVAGTSAPGRPASQRFWTESASGSGVQRITWTIRSGDWMVVVMNADGSAGVSAQVQAGFRTGLLAPIAVGVLTAGLVLLVVGIPLLLVGASGIGRSLPRSAETATIRRGSGATVPRILPVRFVGRAGEPLSRWLWLVKWLLAIPHYLVLVLLWVAFLVSTIAAGVVILFTGRYPRSLFEFDVSVLRWSWRVGFYSYSALGTDRYPPFAFAPGGYPADLEVDYPDRLANGLVLVKWWLLAIPHYLVLAALTGGAVVLPAFWPAFRGTAAAGATTGLSLLGALVLIAAVILLFTGRYPAGVFDLVVGVNRWAYRVVAYTALMRDEYPPFRLDQGADEPVPPVPAASDISPSG